MPPPRRRSARAAGHSAPGRPAGRLDPGRTGRLVYAAILVLAVALTYANSLSGAFVLDDEATIVQNLQIRDLSRLGDVLTPVPDSPIAGRPLASLSFALNYAFHGLGVRGYHAVNIALHAVCVLLVFAIVRRTLERRDPGAIRFDATRLAFGAAVLWAVHPLNSEVVDYLSQRTESLMAACYLVTLYAAIRAAAVPGRGQRPGTWEAAAVLACAAGALCKESIVTAPVVVALYDRVFLFGSWREMWARRARLYGGLAATWIVVAVLVAQGPRAAVVGFASGVAPWTYLLNQALMITAYLRLSIWPDALVAFYGWPLAVTLADVAPYVGFVTALIVLSAVAWRRWPALGFLGIWFFATLAPASSVVPVATEVGAERRMYLPLVALAVLAAVAIEAAVQRALLRSAVPASRARRLTPLAIVAATAMALAVVTVVRNREYESPLALVQTIVERRPTSVARHMLGEQLILAGRHDEAVPQLREAVAGGNSRARYLLGQLLASQEKGDEAIDQLDAFVRTYQPATPPVPRWLEPPLTDVVPARFLLGRALGLRGDWNRAEEQARWILEAVPGHVGAQGLLGDAMFARQQWPAAVEHYRAYLNRQPADTRALINYGVAQVGIERMDGAMAAFRRAAELDPANARARELLQMAEQDRARIAAAQ